MKRPRRLSPATTDAATLLGRQVRLARKQQRWTAAELAERIGISPVTLRKVESGDPSVALGTAFEAASLVGIPLYEDPERRRLEQDIVDARLAALPATVRHPSEPDDSL